MRARKYLIERGDITYVERVWEWAQYHRLDMYKARMGSTTKWVVEVMGSKESMFLLNFGQYCTNIV